jgi:hypothetical protein
VHECGTDERSIRPQITSARILLQQRSRELTSCARQLQGLDEERRVVLSKAISAVAGLGHGTADYAALLAATVSAAVSQVSVTSDVRMFVHQRRVAVMMDELQVGGLKVLWLTGE